MPRAQRRSRRRATRGRQAKAPTNPEFGQRSRAFAAKHSECDFAQIPTAGVSLARVWTKVEDLSSADGTRTSPLIATGFRDGRSRDESADLRELDTTAKIPWDTSARRRVSARLSAEGKPPLATPQRRLMGQDYSKQELRPRDGRQPELILD